MRVFSLFNLPSILRRRMQTFLCLSGIALGIGVVVSVDMAGTSALATFRESVDIVAGKATHQVAPAGPVDLPESILPAVLSAPGVRAAAPVIEQPATLEADTRETILILGVDPLLELPFRDFSSARGSSPRDEDPAASLAELLTDPRAVLVSRPFADRLGLRTGDTIQVSAGARPVGLVIHALFDPDIRSGLAESLVIMDIAAAQEHFSRIGKVDRIDLIADDQAVASLTSVLPPSATVSRAATRSDRIDAMVGAFRLNLLALSLLAVLVGAFLIYNTLTFSVIQRQSQIGVCRSLGMTRCRVARLFLGEALLLSVLGSVLGLAAGWFLSRITVGAVAGTVDQLFTPLGEVAGRLTTRQIALGLLLGTGSGVLAAIVPAWEAASVEPRTAMARSRTEARTRSRIPAATIAAILIFVVSALLAAWPGRSVIPGFVSAFALATGFALLTPAAALLLSRVLEPAARAVAGIPGTLGVRNIGNCLSRTAPAIAAFMIALTMLVGVGLMVGSFRKSLTNWVDATIRADIYIAPAGRGAETATIPDDWVAELSRRPEVAAVDILRRRSVDVVGSPSHLVAVDFAVLRARANYPILDANPETAMDSVIKSGAVLVSETLSRPTGLRAGTTVTLPTPSGPTDFAVAGIYRDYSADGGQVMMHRETYTRHWHDTAANSVALYLRDGANPADTVAQLRTAAAGRAAVLIRSNADLRAEILRVFDRTFAITTVLRGLTLLVAVCGIVSALLALLLERTRELGTLRALGMSRPGMAAMLLSESIAMGLIACAVGLVAGYLLSLLLINVINVRSFGWTIEFHNDPALILGAVMVAVVAAALGAAYPALRISRMGLAGAIREE